MKNIFNTLINNHSNEIDCFRALLEILNQYGYVMASEQHQHYVKHIVHKTSTEKKCEIADLLIIFVSDTFIRYTFMQNKRTDDKNSNKLINKNKITMNPIQWDLLHYKSYLTDTLKTNFSYNILSNALLDSVGSYGIFYNEPNTNQVDMLYSIAKDINAARPITSLPKCNRTFNLPTDYDTLKTNKCENELIATKNLDTFILNGKLMQIGTPIHLNTKINSQIQFLQYITYLTKKEPTNIPSFLTKFNSIVHENFSKNFRDFNLNQKSSIPIAFIPCSNKLFYVCDSINNENKLKYLKTCFNNIKYTNKFDVSSIDEKSIYIIDEHFLTDSIHLLLQQNNYNNIYILQEKNDNFSIKNYFSIFPHNCIKKLINCIKF